MKKLIIMIVSIALVAPVSVARATDSYQLQQVIAAPDCSHTTASAAKGAVNESSCDVFLPNVESVVTRDGYVTITGVYDAVHARSLHVTINGKRYGFAQESVLTSDGNLWILVLPYGPVGLTPGKYPIYLAMTPLSGADIETTTTIVVAEATASAPVATIPAPATVASSQRLQNTGTPVYVLLSVGIALVIIPMLLLIKIRRSQRT